MGWVILGTVTFDAPTWYDYSSTLNAGIPTVPGWDDPELHTSGGGTGTGYLIWTGCRRRSRISRRVQG